VKIVSLKETPTRYVIEVDRAAVEQETTLLQRDGQAVAAIVPIDDYRAFQEWQAAWQRPSVPPEFEAEVAAFEQLKPELLERYRGRAVAIYQGQVIEVGDDKMDVLARVRERLGNVHCYVEWVEPDTPRRARVPSAWVANR
jgi:hypothetical protein